MGEAPAVHRLADYRPPAFRVETVDLIFDLGPVSTRVRSRLQVTRTVDAPTPMRLDGVNLELVSIALDGAPLTADRYSVEPEALVLHDPPGAFLLEVETLTRPRDNKSRTGLIEVDGKLITQCEPEGFRKLTYYPDRPDVLASFTVTLISDRERYPVLLSNGDLIEQADLPNGRHKAVWRDPYPKPSYIFAVIAGDFARLEDVHVTSSGKRVALTVFANANVIERCAFAMAVIKRSLAWDEATYGLEYDLERFNLVAVAGWSGAMENKGLNLFGESGIIADPEIATDDDYIIIERIVAHEIFHNWTGNRVTCRDWFQLCLKEGLTRFRDQHFIEDRLGSGIWRIESVKALRRNQFAEDDGPASHPVQPPTYAEIENFYTNTIYDKGAELFRMLRSMLGRERFRAAFDLYIARHDGSAAVMDDFIKAAEDASGSDLSQFRRWITTAGRPRVKVSGQYDASARRYALTIEQTPPGGAGPFQIPVEIGLVGEDGCALSFTPPGSDQAVADTVIDLRAQRETVVLDGVDEPPAPSVLRAFSAPVSLIADLADDQLARLFVSDSDPFARWDAAQTLAIRTIRRLADQPAAQVPELVVGAYGEILDSLDTPDLLASFLLTVPDEPVLSEGLSQVNLDGLMAGRQALRGALADRFGSQLEALYGRCRENEPYQPDVRGIGRRKLKTAVLDLWMANGSDAAIRACMEQLRTARNMTDGFEALCLIAHLKGPERDEAVAWFYDRWKDYPTVVDKWFNAQALSRAPGAVERIIALEDHPAMDPLNFARSLAFYGGFFRQNRVAFHDPSGKGYEFLADRLLMIDSMGRAGSHYIMPQINQWRRYDPHRRALMKAALERVADAPGISRGLSENVNKALSTGPADA